MDVVRRRLLWLLVAPLAAVASQAAHWAAYRLAVPDPAERAHALASTGHGYLAWLPLAGGIAGALVLAALALRAVAAARGGGPGGAGRADAAPVARWPFALVPLLAFAGQEHLERLLHDGGVPLHAYAERSFLIGLALQVPFGLAAWLLARVLLAAARELGLAVVAARGARRTRRHASVPGRRPAHAPAAPRRSPLSLERAGRAPPLLAGC